MPMNHVCKHPGSGREAIIKYSLLRGGGGGGRKAGPLECRRLVKMMNFHVIGANAVAIQGQKPSSRRSPGRRGGHGVGAAVPQPSSP